MTDCGCGCTDRALDNRSPAWRDNFYAAIDLLPVLRPLVQQDYRRMALVRVLVLTGHLGGLNGEDGPQPVRQEGDDTLLQRWRKHG